MAKLAIVAVLFFVLFYYCYGLPTPDEERYFDKEVSNFTENLILTTLFLFIYKKIKL